MSTPEIASLLRAIADVIERNSPLEIAELTEAMKPSKTAKSRQPASSSKAKSKVRVDLNALSQRLLEATDRTQAAKILEDAYLSRKELADLGRIYDVHLIKEDNIEIIEQKIVESLVGARLNSRAIRGDA
ncbi:hypothetical protein [Novosphingobium cyanobacteriorum]|uniref:Uncharacterized protein n=1 Tax=Novosphingobium cyanobacteriorum TaxID=3024215 RepID=A0ABT6CFZ4_9SPHN|nr:hypothetical protein [Novosphingobium cyanobacteriorum]MDF8332010.1 hypothetical protein [Novosphingobium cyanobacteriorum]